MAVDTNVPDYTSKYVYQEGMDIYNVMLVKQNKNKYYIIQLLCDNLSNYYVWNRWARVGLIGRNRLIPCGSNLELAKYIFNKKFNDKTKNNWTDRKNFRSIPGKYNLVKIDYGSD